MQAHKFNNLKLGVNIDHVATLRQARGVAYPDPMQAAFIAVDAGADSITIHLREDRRHIQERDVEMLKSALTVPMNLEMAATDAMLDLALHYKPEYVCLVPEKRQEITTEGGLNVASQVDKIKHVCSKLAEQNIQVSLFIDPDKDQVNAAAKCGAPVIELHTGKYADAPMLTRDKYLNQIVQMADYANSIGLVVNAGHGLNYQNVSQVAAIKCLNELNIGHSIISHAVFVGLEAAVSTMKRKLFEARVGI